MNQAVKEAKHPETQEALRKRRYHYQIVSNCKPRKLEALTFHSKVSISINIDIIIKIEWNIDISDMHIKEICGLLKQYSTHKEVN